MLTTSSTRTETRLARAGIGVLALAGARRHRAAAAGRRAGHGAAVRGARPARPAGARSPGRYTRLRGTARGALTLLRRRAGRRHRARRRATTPASSGSPPTTSPAGSRSPAALTLIGLGAITLWRTRRRTGRCVARRGALGVAFVDDGHHRRAARSGSPTCHTHAARAGVPENRLGVPTEDVTFKSTDGLELHGWYAPVAQRRGRDRLPRSQGPAGAGAHARPPRLRRAAVRPRAAKAAAKASRTAGAGAATGTSRARSRSSSTAGSTGSAVSASRSAAS